MRIYDIKPPIAKQLGAAKKRTKKYWLQATAFVKSSRYGIPVLALFFLIFAGGIISALTAPERKSITAFPGKVEGDWARQENIKKTDLPPDSLATGFNFKNSTFSYRIFAELNLPQETPGGSGSEIIPAPDTSSGTAGTEGARGNSEEGLPLTETGVTTEENAPANAPANAEAPGVAEETTPSETSVKVTLPPTAEPVTEPAPLSPASEPVAEPVAEMAPQAESNSPPATEVAPPVSEPTSPPAPEPAPSEPVSFWYRFFGAALGQVFAQSETPEETATPDTINSQTIEATETAETPATEGAINSEADAALAKPTAPPIEVDESAKTAVTTTEVDGETTSSPEPSVEANLDAGLPALEEQFPTGSADEPATPKLFTKRKELELSDFKIREDIPFGSEIKEVALNLSMFFAGTGGEDDELLVEYRLDGTWHALKTFTQNEERSNNTEGGYFSLSLPLDYKTV